MGTIVVGYVPTPEGEAALAAAISEARLRTSALVVVSSHTAEATPGADEGPEARAEIDDLTLRLQATELEFRVTYLERGFEPAEDLISVAEVEGADLIVIGMRRRTPVGKLMMGSNSQRILLDAECPVLAVKAPR